MANTVAYSDFGLENIAEIDSKEEPTAFLRLLQKKFSFSLCSRPATNENNVKILHDDQRKAVLCPFYAVQLLSGSTYSKLPLLGTK